MIAQRMRMNSASAQPCFVAQGDDRLGEGSVAGRLQEVANPRHLHFQFVQQDRRRLQFPLTPLRPFVKNTRPVSVYRVDWESAPPHHRALVGPPHLPDNHQSRPAFEYERDAEQTIAADGS